MLRRLAIWLLALVLVCTVSPFSSSVVIYAQDASPVPVEPDPTEIPLPEATAEQPASVPVSEPVIPAEPEGNTPPGFYSANQIHVRGDVYFNVYQITVGGQTDVIDGTNGNGSFDAPGYRTDNAKVLTLTTTAVHIGNFRLCIIFDGASFANPSDVDIFQLQGASWTVLDPVREGSTICGYPAALGVFAVAEPGATPPTATATDIPPTETTTASPTATDLPSSTATATQTASPSPTDTPTASSTATATPSFTATPTTTPSSTSTSSPTETPTDTPTQSGTPSPTQTATEAATSLPSPTPTETTTHTPTASFTPTASHTSIPTNSPSPTATETLTPTMTVTVTGTPSPTASVTETATSTPTASVTETATSAPSPIQFALPNVYVTYAQIPASGTTTGSVISGSDVPPLPAAYLASNAWFFSVSSTVVQSGNKKLCVTFDTAPYADPHRLVLLRSNGSSWSTLSSQILDSLLSTQGTHCGYTGTFGDFALVERTPAPATATLTSSSTPPPTETPSATTTQSPSLTPSITATNTASATSILTSTATAQKTATTVSTLVATGTPTATSTPSASASPSTTPTGTSTASATASPTVTETATPSVTRTVTPTATLAPGSYPPGAMLRATTRVHLRAGASSSATSLGVLPSGAIVTVTGSSTPAGGLNWVPVSSSLGAGWIAGKYLTSVPSATPTRTPGASTPTRTPGGSAPTRTATRPAGGFITGDAVRTTANVNLRSAPRTSSSIIRVVPSRTAATVTGPGVASGGTIFYPVSISGYPAGYLAGSYLQRISASATPSRTPIPTATVTGSTVRYTTSNVNLRRGPGTSYGKIATIPEGTRVNITGAPRQVSGTAWYPVIINGVGSGWMSGAFLTTLPPL